MSALYFATKKYRGSTIFPNDVMRESENGHCYTWGKYSLYYREYLVVLSVGRAETPPPSLLT